MVGSFFSTTRASDKYNAKITPIHITPISSPRAAKIKSLCASGRYPNFCNHFPYHFPTRHHHQIASNACLFCRQISLLFSYLLGRRK